ncbi:MAG: trypsin-like peptidase domain-containing protein [Bacteroidetes bacterium]|nr:trypsin-like peptidase domain-containing protein [Bacteroidota bacterium]MBL7102692.1 trypsin-like peptidase domain-containing protein [Bacteroidales bacterium]
MTKILLLIIGLSIFGFSFSQTDSLGIDLDLNIVLMKNTYLISGNNSCGTGFIVTKEKKKNNEKKKTSKRAKKDLNYIFITAAHVLDSIIGNEAYIYLRTYDNGIYKTFPFPLLIRNKRTNYYKKHPTMDVAAMYVTLPKIFDNNYFSLSEGLFINDNDIKTWNIRTGETINCLGFPYCSYDSIGCFPILRSGKIASYPIIPSSVYSTFYFDFEVYPGNSGGPVYFFEDGMKARSRSDQYFLMGGPHLQFIMGLVSQQRYVVDDTKDTIFIKLARVIHSKYILETIEMLP